MKFWKDQCTFNFPWDRIVQAAYRKYPNQHNPNVQCLDTLERRNITPSRLYSHRLFSTLWNVPSIVLTILGTNQLMYIHEESVCDVENKTLRIVARNLSILSLFRMEETLEYQIHPDDPSKTLLTQTAKMDVHGVPLLGSMLESLLISSYSGVVGKGRLAVEEKAKLIMDECNIGPPSDNNSSPLTNM